MATTRHPRFGTLQFWHRRRASRPYSRVRSYAKVSEAKLLGFAGYKVGMTHAIITDNRPNAMTKGEEIFMPVTVVECPPLRLISIRFYISTSEGLKCKTEVLAKLDAQAAKYAEKKLRSAKTDKSSRLGELGKDLSKFNTIRVLVCTQPHLIGFKKKPEVFELAIGGSIEDQFNFAKERLGKEIKLEDVFAEGNQVDIYGVTKGKGFEGPIKRFGIGLKNHKTEKGSREPGNIGPWTGNRSWTVPHAGQMGYHNRFERNKWIVKITSNGAEITPKGGFLHYGNVKNTAMLIKGSVSGTAKRIIRMNVPQRKNVKVPEKAPTVEYVSIASKQGL
jgi:large subunit ribosomal protein L3